VPWATLWSDAWSTPWACHRRQGPIDSKEFPQDRDQGARNHLAQRCARAGADRHQGHRFMIPIGRGQRELIIGDRQTARRRSRRHHYQSEGPEHVLLSTWPSARSSPPVPPWSTNCGNTAPWSSPPWCRPPRPSRRRCSSLAPYTGVTMGEYFRDSGRHALMILRRSVQARRWPTANSRCCCVARPGRPPRMLFPGGGDSSDCTRVCSTAAKMSTEKCAARSHALAGHRNPAAICRPTIPTNVILHHRRSESSWRTTLFYRSAAA